MQFSIFKNSLNSWQGTSLIIAIFQEDIKTQLELIDFTIDTKILIEKINRSKFKGEKGKEFTLNFMDQKLQNLIIIGLGEKSNFVTESLKDSFSECLRKFSQKEEKISILLPWESINKEAIYVVAESIRLSI